MLASASSAADSANSLLRSRHLFASEFTSINVNDAFEAARPLEYGKPGILRFAPSILEGPLKAEVDTMKSRFVGSPA